MARIDGTSGRDDVHGTAQGDVFFMKDGDDKADGWGGADEMHGGAGHDTMNGGDGNDLLIGDAGNDVLRGGEGRDTLVGGPGADQLYGGAGDDRFFFTTIFDGNGIDTIYAFTHGSDRIDLSEIDANHNVAGDQAFRFIGDQAFTGHAGELNYHRYDLGDGWISTWVQADVDGDREGDLLFTLDGNYTMTSSDFIL